MSHVIVPTLTCALVGAVSGWLVPRLIATLPEPEHDPDDESDDLPAKVSYLDVAAGRWLPWSCLLACSVSAGLLGGLLGWTWSLPWLVFLVPVGCALTVIDYRTWFLPYRLVAPSYAIVIVLIVVAAFSNDDWHIVRDAVLGWVTLGLYYGGIWYLSPRLMAYGDVRLGGLLGLALGPLGIVEVTLSVPAASTLGLLCFIPLRLTGAATGHRLPYGPFLIVGALVAVLAGSQINLG